MDRKKHSNGKKSKSGIRTKFLIESLRNEYYALRQENDRLRNVVTSNLPEHAARQILAECYDPNAPRASVGNIDDLAGRMAGADLDDDDDDF